MRRSLVAFTLLGLMAAAASAADEKGDKKADSNKEKESKTLKPGDPAPRLTASKWLQGKEVTGFTPGKVYVVEFWATWCGPCLQMMPHLGELQSEYKDKGLTIVGYTTSDPNNSLEKVTEFVAKRGPKLGYTFAFSSDEKTYDAWMGAAGRNGIPCSFVVDQKGKIAYIGHPMFLGEVLSKVIAGTWKAEQGASEMAEVEKDLDALIEKLNGPNAEAAVTALKEFEAKRPGLASLPFLSGPRILILLRGKKVDDARKAADALLARAIEQEDVNALRTVAGITRTPEAKGDKGLTDVSLKASDALLKLSGEKDLIALVTAAEANFAAGNGAKAREFGKRAVEAAADESEETRNEVKSLVKKYDEKVEDGKKDEKK